MRPSTSASTVAKSGSSAGTAVSQASGAPNTEVTPASARQAASNSSAVTVASSRAV